MAEMVHQSPSMLIDALNYIPQTEALVMDYISKLSSLMEGGIHIHSLHS